MRVKRVRPTALPWTFSGITGDTYIMGARSFPYEGWPNFGKPVVCEMRYAVSVEEGEANKEFIVAACNGCFEVNRNNPLAAAMGYPALVRAAQNVVALEMSDARHVPVVREVIALVSSALEQVRRET